MRRGSSTTRGGRRTSYAGPNVEFYNSALANNSLPTEWKKDDNGVWRRGSAASAAAPLSSATSGTNLSSQFSPFEAPGGFDELAIYDDTDATSISSALAELEGYRSSSPETDKTLSRRETPSPPPLRTADAIAGIGDGVSSERQPRRGLWLLEEPNDGFERQFVEYRREVAIGNIQACEAGQHPDSQPNHLSVSTHDELCLSNGPERVNEERVAICGYINIQPHEADQACTTCLRLPDYYQDSDTRSVTQEESGMAAREVEDRYRSGGGI